MKHVGICGGGPAALFLYKQLIASGNAELSISIFEKNDRPGPGMPYSPIGADTEHITNVSDNEIPELFNHMRSWIRTAPTELLERFEMKAESFNEYKVVPRLLFGEYLADQFELLQRSAKKAGIETIFYTNTEVTDVRDYPQEQKVHVFTKGGDNFLFDTVIICIGHRWPKTHEGKIPGWFDSPYPPGKLSQKLNYPVAIKGASLTAIDAVRSLAFCNGSFVKDKDGKTTYQLRKESEGFHMYLHSLDGLLPAVRFHLRDTHLNPDSPITEDEVFDLKAKHGGFIPLDYIFNRNFLEPLRKHQPVFYEQVEGLTIEDFVDKMMALRERLDPFQLLKGEYEEAAKSIRRHESVYWKEMLAILSYAMNYPAKHLSAEDRQRLQKVLMPLISIVIAFVPQSSVEQLLALHEAGVLDVIAVDKDSTVEPVSTGGAIYTYTNEIGEKITKDFKMYINAVGQPPLAFEDVPFEQLKKDGSISRARLAFKSNEAGEQEMLSGNRNVSRDSDGRYYLQVPGININDHFQVLDQYGAYNSRIYMMAVPYIAGLNPDYSGLDFCETAAERIVNAMKMMEALPGANAA